MEAFRLTSKLLEIQGLVISPLESMEFERASSYYLGLWIKRRCTSTQAAQAIKESAMKIAEDLKLDEYSILSLDERALLYLIGQKLKVAIP